MRSYVETQSDEALFFSLLIDFPVHESHNGISRTTRSIGRVSFMSIESEPLIFASVHRDAIGVTRCFAAGEELSKQAPMGGNGKICVCWHLFCYFYGEYV